MTHLDHWEKPVGQWSAPKISLNTDGAQVAPHLFLPCFCPVFALFHHMYPREKEEEQFIQDGGLLLSRNGDLAMQVSMEALQIIKMRITNLP